MKPKFSINDRVKICIASGYEIKGCKVRGIRISQDETRYEIAIPGECVEGGATAFDLMERCIAKEE